MAINYLIVVTIVLILFSLAIGIYVAITQVPSVTSSLLGGSTSCSISYLPDVTNDPNYVRCKNLDGYFYSSYWFDKSKSWTLGPLSSPQFSQTAEQICFGSCTRGVLPYSCDSNDTEYTACVSQLSPGDCSTPSRPIARYGNVALYVISIGSYVCL